MGEMVRWDAGDQWSEASRKERKKIAMIWKCNKKRSYGGRRMSDMQVGGMRAREQPKRRVAGLYHG